MRKLIPIFIFIGLVLTAFGEVTPAQEAEFIINIIDNVDWPSGTGGKFIISVVGNGKIAQALTDAAGKKSGGKFNIKINTITADDDFSEAQMVVITDNDKAALAKVLKQAGGKPILTVTNVAGFARYGVMVELISPPSSNKIDYAVNRMVANKSGLKISDKFISDAIKVFG
nr:YfiR family protein [candidate division Zixibacteria bacterium]